MSTKHIERRIGAGRPDFAKATRGKNPDESPEERAARIARETAAHNASIERQKEEKKAMIAAKKAEREERRGVSEKPAVTQAVPGSWTDNLPSSAGAAKAGLFAEKGKRGSQVQQRQPKKDAGNTPGSVFS